MYNARMRSLPTLDRCTRVERTLLTDPGTPLPTHNDDWRMCTLAILSFSVFFNFQTCMSLRCPLKCGVPMLCTTSSKCLRMRASLGSTLTGEFWGGHLDGVAGTLGFPLERRVSLVLIMILVAAAGANRTLLRRLLGGWAFALAFGRQAFACLDVACSAAASLAPTRRCRVSGALLDELLLITGLAPLFETNLRAEPCDKLYAAQDSPDGAGGCPTSVRTIGSHCVICRRKGGA